VFPGCLPTQIDPARIALTVHCPRASLDWSELQVQDFFGGCGVGSILDQDATSGGIKGSEREGIQESFTHWHGCSGSSGINQGHADTVQGIGRTVPVDAVTEMEERIERIEGEVMEERNIFRPRNAKFENFPGCA